MADKTMGELTAASTPLMDSDLIAVSRGGTSTRKVAISQLLALLDSSFSGDAADVPYTPTTAGDWDDVPTDVQEALDELAEVVNAIASGTYTFVDDSTGARTLQLSDQSTALAPKIIRASHGTANEVTVPPTSSVAFPVGAQVNVYHDTGTLTFVAGSGVTIAAPPGGTLVSAGQFGMFVLIRLGAEIWQLIGPTEAA